MQVMLQDLNTVLVMSHEAYLNGLVNKQNNRNYASENGNFHESPHSDFIAVCHADPFV